MLFFSIFGLSKYSFSNLLNGMNILPKRGELICLFRHNPNFFLFFTDGQSITRYLKQISPAVFFLKINKYYFNKNALD
jgi:hypothetical protein